MRADQLDAIFGDLIRWLDEFAAVAAETRLRVRAEFPLADFAIALENALRSCLARLQAVVRHPLALLQVEARAGLGRRGRPATLRARSVVNVVLYDVLACEEGRVAPDAYKELAGIY